MIYPKCKHKENQVPAIRYDGYVVPCCHFGQWQDIDRFRERMGDLVETMHITNGTLDEINNSPAWKYIEDSFDNEPFARCVKHCSGGEENYSPKKTNAESDFKVIDL